MNTGVESAGGVAHVVRKTLIWLSLAVFLCLGFGIRCWNTGQVFHDGGVFFVDADCYSRMTRVQQVLNSPWRSIRFHDFENAPVGTHPHTTAPMDLAIAGLTKVFGLRYSLLDSFDAAALAGAFISPLLGVILVGFLGWWAYRLELSYRNALLMLVVFSPILVHGFLLGRPDHQSLILLLIGMSFAAEIAIWQGRSTGWSFLSAAAWGLALWTSLFEPLILLLAILACRVLVLERGAFRIRSRPAAGVFVGVLLVAVLFDGWRFKPSETGGGEFFRWAQTIGELNHLQFKQLLPWTGWLLPVVPVLLIIRFTKERCRISLALALLVILTIGLSLWYARWGYFLALIFAISLPWAFASIPWKPVVWVLFVISLWPMASEWDRQLFPDRPTADARAEARTEATLLRETAQFLRSSDRGIVLAPWWLSPPIAYWSGLPCVAGSSHQSLSGIVATAKFYMASSGFEAEAILKERQVRWVVAYEPSRLILNSQQILGVRAERPPLIQSLYNRPTSAPKFLRPAYQNVYFRVFENAAANGDAP